MGINTVNTAAILSRLQFKSLSGNLVLVDPSGITTQIQVTTPAGSQSFKFSSIEKTADGYAIRTTNGSVIEIGDSDGLAVTEAVTASLPRQKMVSTARNVALIVFGALVLVVIVVVLAH